MSIGFECPWAIEEIELALDKEAFEGCDILFTCSIEELRRANFFIVAVPTPVDEHNIPDLKPVQKASETIGSVIKKGDYVVFESTVYPGCTEGDCLPIIEKLSGLKNITDFKLGYSPERINPGDKVHTLANVIKVVSGCDHESLEEIAKVYELVVRAGVHRTTCIKVAEAAKAYEEALVLVDKDKDLEPEDRETRAERYHYMLSNIYVDIRKVDKASEHLQVLLAKHPDNPGFNNDLGYIWADHDIKLEEAEKLIRKALELDRKKRKDDPKLKPEQDIDNGAYLDSLGWVLFKQKKFKEAKVAMLKAVEDKKSQHIEIYDHLGDVLMALGERAAAIAAWKKGIEVVGDDRRDKERRAIVEKKLQMNK